MIFEIKSNPFLQLFRKLENENSHINKETVSYSSNFIFTQSTADSTQTTISAKTSLTTSSSKPPADDMSFNRSSYHYSFGAPIFTGPDALRPTRRPKLDSTYIGFSKNFTAIGSLDTGHVIHDTPQNPFPRRSFERVGGIGWGLSKPGAYDVKNLKSGHQIQRKYFRDQKEGQLSRRPPFP